MERRLASIVAVVSAIVIAVSYGQDEIRSWVRSLKSEPMPLPKTRTGVIAYVSPVLKHSVDSNVEKRYERPSSLM